MDDFIIIFEWMDGKELYFQKYDGGIRVYLDPIFKNGIEVEAFTEFGFGKDHGEAIDDIMEKEYGN